jgi:ABC-type Na+ efflux pump permease subunit
MRQVLLSAIKDLRRLRRDPIALVTWIGVPLLIGLILVALFGHEDPKPHGLVLIADRDDSLLSSFVARAYSQGNLGEMFTVQQVPLDEGRRRINSGDGSALLIIPKGFSDAVLRREPVQLQLITNPSQTILPGIAESVTATMVDGAWYLQSLLGGELGQLAGTSGRPSDALIASLSVRIHHLATDAAKYIDPPLISVATEVVEKNPGRRVNMTALMFPSMVYMAVMFLGFGFAADIWKEKMQGTLRRLAVTPASVAGLLGGKLAAVGVLYAALGIVALATGKFVVGAEVHSPVLAVAWVVVSGGVMYLLFLVVSALCPNPRAGSVLTNLMVMVLAMIGGTFFPFEMMPEFLARIGRLTPNGWAVVRFREILAGQLDAASLATGFGGMALLAALLFLAAASRLRRRFVV